MSFSLDFQNRDVLSLSDFGISAELDWLKDKKQQSLLQFKTAPLPSRKVEHWKYNDMHFISQQNYHLTEKLVQPFNSYTSTSIEFKDSIEIVFVNGYLNSDLSNLQSIEGLKITDFDACNEQQKKIIIFVYLHCFCCV